MSPRHPSYRIPILSTLAAAAVAACTGSPAPTSEVEQLAVSCVDLPATGDATLSSASLRETHGARPVIRASHRDEGLLHFDIGSIPPGAAIRSAAMKLFVSQAAANGPTSIAVHRATAAWDEATVT